LAAVTKRNAFSNLIAAPAATGVAMTARWWRWRVPSPEGVSG
jgi:hypothetical protein